MPVLKQAQQGSSTSMSLPPNMDVIYDYMQEAGEMTWTATPALNVSTKDIEPIGVSNVASPRTTMTTPVNNPVTPATSPATDNKRQGRRP